jgi:hypothetical protein
MSRLIVCTITAFLAGCAQPCFYQAGKRLEECRRDLRQCLVFGQPELCMQSKGYQLTDARKLPRGRERIKVVARSGQYWVMDGHGMTHETKRVPSVPESQTVDWAESQGRIVEYRVERGDLGTLKITLVYEDGQK